MTLREARKALGWTQQTLEAKSRVKQQTISALENGDIGRVSLETARLVLVAFHQAGLRGLTLEELFPVDAETTERVS